MAGFHTWKKLSRYVKKGEKGITIIAPLVGRQSDKGSDDDRTVCGFRAVYVFDISQTEGEPLPEIGSIKGNPGIFTERLRELVVNKGITLEYSRYCQELCMTLLFRRQVS